MRRAVTTSWTAGAGSSGVETVYEVADGETFEGLDVLFRVAGDPAGDVDVAVYAGETRVAPHDGDLTLVSRAVEVAAGVEADVGDVLEVRWANSSGGTAYDVTVVLEADITLESA